jgi:hypothetical protein
MDVSSHGSIATLATENGVGLVDFSPPSKPAELGRMVTEAAARVEVSDNTTAVGLGWDRDSVGAISLVDRGHRRGPCEVAVIESDRAWIAAFALSGDRLYLLQEAVQPSPNPTLRVIDLSAPAEPRELGTATLAGPVDWVLRDLAVEGDYAYVPIDDSLRVIDVSDPASSMEVATLVVGDYTSSVEVDGSRAFVGASSFDPWCRGDVLTVVDVSDPTQPSVVDAMYPPLGMELEVDGGMLAGLAGGGCGSGPLHLDAGVLDVSEPGTHALISYGWLWEGYSSINADIARLDHFVYVSIDTEFYVSELRIYDLGDAEWSDWDYPSMPLPSVGAVTAAGDILLVTDRELGLLVLDPTCVAACYGHDPRVGPCPVEQDR